MGRGTFAVALILLAAAACRTPVVSRLEVVSAGSVGRDELVVRRLEDGRRVDVERARRELAAWFDRRGAPPPDEVPANDWPAPDGCRWVLVPDRLDVAPAVRTPRGRAVLVRVDDGLDLHLRELDAVAAERLGGRRALRLRASEARRGALAELAGSTGGVLLLVGGDEARVAVRAPAGLVDEVLLVGTTKEIEAAVLDRAGG